MQTLSCHCGHIRLEVDAPLQGLRQCNCSTCRRFGAIHWYVPARAVRGAPAGFYWARLTAG